MESAFALFWNTSLNSAHNNSSDAKGGMGVCTSDIQFVVGAVIHVACCNLSFEFS